MSRMWNRLCAGWRALTGPQMYNPGIDAARFDDGWAGTGWPTLSVNQEVDQWDLQNIWRRARMLYMNCPPIRHAVKNMVAFTGVLMPLPMTKDEEWNELARAAFLTRTKNPHTFDAAGRLNFAQAQDYMETWAIVDGDIAMLPSIGRDGGAVFAFYRAPQIDGGGEAGVEVDGNNKPVAYYIAQGEGKNAVRVPAWQVVMYQHDPDPQSLRHESELVAAVRHGQDIRQIVGYNKAGIKLASQFGLIETVDAQAGVGSLSTDALVGGRKNRVQTPQGPRYLADTGISITRLDPGHRVTTVQDNRPSQQVMEFIHFLVANIAWAVGLDKELLFYSEKMASGGVRLNLEKLKRWQCRRRIDRETVCNRIWTQVIALEMSAGRLRVCRDENWRKVMWVAPRDMTVDLGRETKAHLDLAAKGMDDVDSFCLAVHGKPWRRLLEEKAHNLAHAKELAAKYGLAPAELVEVAAGAVTVPGEAADEHSGNAGHPVPEDDDPE